MIKNKLSQENIEKIEKKHSKPDLTIQFYKEEKDCDEIHQLIPEDCKEKAAIVGKSSAFHFPDAYIERCEKASEQVVSIEDSSFLNKPIVFLKKHRDEFIYLESDCLDLIGVDAISIELDDVFGTYEAMLGLKLKKKNEKAIEASLSNHLTGGTGDIPKFNLLFNHVDELWDVNIMLKDIDGFKEDMTIGDTCQIVYELLLKIVADVKKNRSVDCGNSPF